MSEKNKILFSQPITLYEKGSQCALSSVKKDAPQLRCYVFIIKKKQHKMTVVMYGYNSKAQEAEARFLPWNLLCIMNF